MAALVLLSAFLMPLSLQRVSGRLTVGLLSRASQAGSGFISRAVGALVESASCTVRVASCACMWAESGSQRLDEPPPAPRQVERVVSYFCGVYACWRKDDCRPEHREKLGKTSEWSRTTLAGAPMSISPGRATRPEPRLRPSVGAVQQPTASSIRRCTALTRFSSAATWSGVCWDRLLDDVRGGASRALVVYGEAGMGKTALLEYLAGRASLICRVVRSGRRPRPRWSSGVRRLAPVVRTCAGPPRRGTSAPT